MATRRDDAPPIGERAAIELLQRLLASGGRGVELGIGDDAAVLKPARGRLVWTVDVCVEGVHFQRGWLSWRDVGWRATQAAVSDLAAMGATPLGALSSLIYPPGFGARRLGSLGRGQAEAAQALGCPVVGGNVSRGTELSVTTTVLGTARRPLRRDAARPGHELWLVGDVGLARMGLELLKRGSKRRGVAERACLSAWRRPEAQLRRGLALVGRAESAIDLSDGLAGDAGHIARSSGVRLVVEQAALRAALRPELVAVCARVGLDAGELALSGGEDYALLAAGPPALRPRWARRIGRVERGSSVVLERDDGSLCPLRGGFDHFD